MEKAVVTTLLGTTAVSSLYLEGSSILNNGTGELQGVPFRTLWYTQKLSASYSWHMFLLFDNGQDECDHYASPSLCTH